MKRVALVGFNSKTMSFHKSAPDGCEIWSLNHAWKYDIPRVDRLFEIHKPEHRKNSNKITKQHDDWLQERHSFPIYTIPKLDYIPASKAYPYEQVVDKFCGGLLAGDKVQKVFTSTFDYMMALAIYEGFDEIYIYGFAMDGDSEYRFQRDGLAYWFGFATAKGIKVIQHEKSTTLRPKVYHEGGQMIGRQIAEHHRITHEEQVRKLENKLATKQGAYGVLSSLHQKGKVTDEAVQNAQQELWQTAEELAIARGAAGAIAMLIKDHDTEGNNNGDN